MRSRLSHVAAIALLFLLSVAVAWTKPGESSSGDYKVLGPITSGNLTIYPVVASRSYDTSQFITLDEGLRSGAVQVTEYGQLQRMVRRPLPYPQPRGNAEVNRLMLVNNSDRPLLLLAGEIVTGGKQDRVVGADRIVPAQSGPVDMSVFCVEPGRWTSTTGQFHGAAAPMAQPSVRRQRDQQSVWDNVRASQNNAAKALPAREAAVIGGTTSYATVMQNDAVEQNLDKLSKPIQENYDSVMRALRDRHAVGVVVAVNGRLIWADLFASTALLQSYWPKLVRSYAAEAFTAGSMPRRGSKANAQDFLNELSGRREVVETDPGVYRRSEITGDAFKVFTLTSLLPKTGFEVHIAKMADDDVVFPMGPRLQR